MRPILLKDRNQHKVEFVDEEALLVQALGCCRCLDYESDHEIPDAYNRQFWDAVDVLDRLSTNPGVVLLAKLSTASGRHCPEPASQ